MGQKSFDGTIQPRGQILKNHFQVVIGHLWNTVFRIAVTCLLWASLILLMERPTWARAMLNSVSSSVVTKSGCYK